MNLQSKYTPKSMPMTTSPHFPRHHNCCNHQCCVINRYRTAPFHQHKCYHHHWNCFAATNFLYNLTCCYPFDPYFLIQFESAFPIQFVSASLIQFDSDSTIQLNSHCTHIFLSESRNTSHIIQVKSDPHQWESHIDYSVLT